MSKSILVIDTKKLYTAPERNHELQKDLFAVGWNACLREITETSDENER